MNTKFNFMNVLISLACNDKVITVPFQILSNLVSWFSSVGDVSSLLQPLSSPGEVFWWSYYVTKMECAPQIDSGFFQTLTEVDNFLFLPRSNVQSDISNWKLCTRKSVLHVFSLSR